ncbi:porin family protein [Mucilaginibacter arboris]|uniref:Outer membrane beta-barrel protein n=1 Tax=Mucilaginibacter arboris TaxID=2682090 RepID=A0A7K1T0Q7_9SPHI|nr:porin family protein [Mucilaginibacter arboris]MVN22860.1 outer membrane beta-barrel protein [Mucilaginibacter arboris]
MKKYFFTVLVAALSFSAKAQFSLGVKGGVNFSHLSVNNGQINASELPGYQIGLWTRIGKGFYVQPEVYLGSSGSNFNFQYNHSNQTVTESGKVRFTTLNVPLLLGQSFGLSKLNFRLMAGPMYSYVLNNDQNLSQNIKNAYQDFGNYRNSTLGYQAGAGIDILNFSVDLRYEGGLTEINPAYGQRQNVWHLSLGYKFL